MSDCVADSGVLKTAVALLYMLIRPFISIFEVLATLLREIKRIFFDLQDERNNSVSLKGYRTAD